VVSESSLAKRGIFLDGIGNYRFWGVMGSLFVDKLDEVCYVSHCHVIR
jgi:hypothetical protein